MSESLKVKGLWEKKTDDEIRKGEYRFNVKKGLTFQMTLTEEESAIMEVLQNKYNIDIHKEVIAYMKSEFERLENT